MQWSPPRPAEAALSGRRHKRERVSGGGGRSGSSSGGGCAGGGEAMSKENVPPVAGFGRGPHVNARAKSEKQPVVRRRKAAAKADTQPDAAALNAITHPSVAFLFDPERSARPPARPGGLRRPPPFQLAPADSRAAPAGTRSSRRHTGSLETRECTRRGRWASGRSSAATRPCRTACAGWQNTPSSSTPTAWYPPPPHTHRPPPPAAFRLPPSAPRRGPLAAASNGRALNAGARASAQVGKAEYMRVHKAVCRVLAPKMGADEATASAESGVPCPALPRRGRRVFPAARARLWSTELGSMAAQSGSRTRAGRTGWTAAC